MVYDSNRGGVVRVALFVLCLLMIPASRADEICKREKVDPEYPAGLAGKYEIIGRMPDSDVTYGGTLEIKTGKTAYTLRRTVGGSTAIGEAWFESCGPDEIQVFSFKYTQGKRPLEGYCFIRTDGDNNWLLSCHTNFVGVPYERNGLESMFQLPGS